MDLEKLKAEHPDLVKAIKDEAAQETESKFSGQIEKMENTITAQGEQILQFQKSEALRAERDLKLEADAIWTRKLAESDIPERLHGKVRAQVGHSKFVADGKLDTEAFTAAIDTEINDWADLGVNTEVLGMGGSSKKVDEDSTNREKMAAETDAMVVDLASRAGVKKAS